MHSHFFFYNGKLQHKTLKVEKWLLRTLPVAFLLEFAYCGHLAGYLFITKTKCLPVKNLIESGSFKSWGKVHFGHFIPSKCAVLFDLIDLKKKKALHVIVQVRSPANFLNQTVLPRPPPGSSLSLVVSQVRQKSTLGK